MRSQGDKRSVVKWGGAILAVFGTLVWVVSGWYGIVRYSTSANPIHVEVARGAVSTYQMPAPNPAEHGIALEAGLRPGWIWWFYSGSFSGRAVDYVHVPFWPLPLIAGAVSMVAWLRERGSRESTAGWCPTCRYDRRGLAPNVSCPECGGAPPSAVAASGPPNVEPWIAYLKKHVRRRKSLCHSCGCEWRGLADAAACPECGAVRPKSSA